MHRFFRQILIQKADATRPSPCPSLPHSHKEPPPFIPKSWICPTGMLWQLSTVCCEWTASQARSASRRMQNTAKDLLNSKPEAIQRWSAICPVWPSTLTYQKFLLCISIQGQDLYSHQKLNMYIYWFSSESGYRRRRRRHHSTTTRATYRQLKQIENKFI